MKQAKNDPFYRMIQYAKEATPEETEETLEAIGQLSDDDLQVADEKTFPIRGGNMTAYAISIE